MFVLIIFHDPRKPNTNFMRNFLQNVTHNDRASSTMNLFKLNLEKFHQQTYFSSRAGIQSAETDRRRELN